MSLNSSLRRSLYQRKPLHGHSMWAAPASFSPDPATLGTCSSLRVLAHTGPWQYVLPGMPTLQYHQQRHSPPLQGSPPQPSRLSETGAHPPRTLSSHSPPCLTPPQAVSPTRTGWDLAFWATKSHPWHSTCPGVTPSPCCPAPSCANTGALGAIQENRPQGTDPEEATQYTA